MDPCEDLTDDDIRTAIQNATGPKSALFVPEVGLLSSYRLFIAIWNVWVNAKISYLIDSLFVVSLFLGELHPLGAIWSSSS